MLVLHVLIQLAAGILNFQTCIVCFGGYERQYAEKKLGKDANTEGDFFWVHDSLVITSYFFYLQHQLPIIVALAVESPS